MTTYYVSWDNGSDSNNGLGPDASDATNKPFKTLGKCIAVSGVAASGDTIYICPGTQRETIVVSLAPTAETQIIGDVLNAQGFKSAAGVTVTPGPCRVSAWTTNDKTAPSSSSVIIINNKNYYTFKNLEIYTGSGIGLSINGSNINVLDCCIFTLTGNGMYLNMYSTASTVNINRCHIYSNLSTGISVASPTVSGSNYNLNINISNCFIMTSGGSSGISFAPSGSLSGLPGGITVSNCTIYSYYGVYVLNAYASLTYPVNVVNTFVNGWYGLRATTDGSLISSYCAIYASSALTNVTNATNCITDKSYCPLLCIGQEYQWMGRVMNKYSPQLDSPFLGYGNASGAPVEDILGLARPSGCGPVQGNALPGIGCYENHEFGAQETSITDGGSGSSLRLTGPGDMVRNIAVDATSSTISIKARYDTNHGTSNKPQVQLMPCPEIGYAGETLTMSAAVDTWETLTFTAFTPSKSGFVRIRFISRAAAGNGNAYFDTLNVS